MAWRRLWFVSLLLVSLFPASTHAQIVMARGVDSDPVLRILNPNGTNESVALPQDPWHSMFGHATGFRGGVRVALGDVDGDGIADIITGSGPSGAPQVRVWNGADHSLMANFYAYPAPFSGGIFVAAGDVNGDGHADIITGAGADGSQVKVFSGFDLWVNRLQVLLASFSAYGPDFTGGVFVAAGDVNGDGRADLITGAGPGGGPHVRVFNGADLSELASFYAYNPIFEGGVSVASLDFNGDGHADILTGAGRGGGPHVRVFSGADLSELAGFFAYDPLFRGGVSVAGADVDGDGKPELVTGAGPSGGPHVKVFRVPDLAVVGSFYAFDPSYTGGVFVASLPGSGGVVTACCAPEFVPGYTAGYFLVGESMSWFSIIAGGNPAPAITVDALPAGLTIRDNGNGSARVTGTPAAGTAGNHTVTFTAANGHLPNATLTVPVWISERPAITSGAATTFVPGTFGSFTVTTSGFPAPWIFRGGVPLPAGVTFTDTRNGTGTLSGTPEPGTSGTYAIMFRAENVQGHADQAFTLTVDGPPSLTSASTKTSTEKRPPPSRSARAVRPRRPLR